MNKEVVGWQESCVIWWYCLACSLFYKENYGWNLALIVTIKKYIYIYIYI